MRKGEGGEGGWGAPHVPPIKIFEKLPHKNAIKHDPKYPPQNNLPKTPKDLPPPLDFQLLCRHKVWLRILGTWSCHA